MSIRSLLVREGHRDYILKDQAHKGSPVTPFILLKGSWLENAGFSIGLSVNVDVEPNKLTITPKIE